MKNQAISEEKRRSVFNVLKGEYVGKRIQPSYLRQEVVLKNNQSNYEFNFAELVAAALNATERRLRRTDAFKVLGMSLQLLIEETLKPGKGVLITYPNPFQVNQVTSAPSASIPGVAVVSPKDLNAVYNGTISASVNNDTQFEYIETRQFLTVPSTQENSINDYTETDIAAGMISLEPHLLLNGKNTNKFVLTIPTWNAIAIQSHKPDWDIKAVLLLDGFHIPGVNS